SPRGRRSGAAATPLPSHPCSLPHHLTEDPFLPLPHPAAYAPGALRVVVAEHVQRAVDGEPRQLLRLRPAQRRRLPQRLIVSHVHAADRRFNSPVLWTTFTPGTAIL